MFRVEEDIRFKPHVLFNNIDNSYKPVSEILSIKYFNVTYNIAFYALTND